MAPKPLQRASINSFLKGLITEANPLEYPENASIDELNMDMDITGRRFRRLGMDKETNGVVVPTSIRWTDLDVIEYNTFLWEQVAGEPGLNFIVIQIGNQLMFFRPGEENISLTGLVGTVVINPFVTNKRYYMAALDGFLVIASGADTIAIVEYNKATLTFSFSLDRLRVRDLFGIEETLNPNYENDVSYRGALNQQHYYNLFNQGWGIPRWDWIRWGNSLQDPVFLASDKGRSTYPSNADVVWSGVDFRGIGEDDDGQPNNVEAFNYQQFVGVTGADITAARGYFIIDALRRGTSRQEQWIANKAKYPQVGNLVGLDFSTKIDQTTGGPSCVAAHAGRIFYSGFSGMIIDGDARSPNYNNHVFFSQIVKNKADFGKCYQEGDPTSRETHDIVDSDGGFLKISGANRIVSLFTMGSRLIVIADNGVWSITGGSDYGFSATNYRVDKLSTFGGIAPSSVVIGGDTAYFWAAEAIYAVGVNDMGDISVTNITNETIKTFYANIPANSKKDAYGVYDIYSKRVRWMYRDSELLSETNASQELILDTQIQCFFPFQIRTLENHSSFLIGGVKTPPFNVHRFDDLVFAEEEQVITSLDDTVIATLEMDIPSNAAIKYVGVSQINGFIGIYFSMYTNTKFRDWESFDGFGIDAAAHIETGTITTGDVAINKQIPYITMVFEDTEKRIINDVIDQESSCIGRVQWDFGSGSQSNKWSRNMQMYRKSRFFYPDESGSVDGGFSKTITKTKLRGRGRAFALRFETEPFKNLQIRGWVLTVTSNGVT